AGDADEEPRDRSASWQAREAVRRRRRSGAADAAGRRAGPRPDGRLFRRGRARQKRAPVAAARRADGSRARVFRGPDAHGGRSAAGDAARDSEDADSTGPAAAQSRDDARGLMATSTNDHDVYKEQAALYALGALTEPERVAFEAHASGCAECGRDVRELSSVAAVLPLTVPQYDPPPGLRDRVLGTAGARSSRIPGRPAMSLAPWLSAAAALMLAAGLGASGLSPRNRGAGLEGQLRDAMVRLDASEQQTAVARRLVASLQTPIAVLTAPDLRRFDLRGEPAAPQASARAFWSRARGLVFTGSQ